MANMMARRQNLFGYLERVFGMGADKVVHVVPEATACGQCGRELVCVPHKANTTLLANCFLSVQIYQKFCHTCHLVYKYDGHSHGIINWSNQLLITMELVMEYMLHFASSAQPVSAWWSDMCLNQLGMYSTQQGAVLMGQWGNYAGHIAQAMAGAAELVTFPDKVFKCCDEPECLSMDGTVISIAQKNMPTFEQPWVDPAPCVQQTTLRSQRQLPQLKVTEHMLVKNYSDRTLGIGLTRLQAMFRSTNSGVRLLAHLCDQQTLGMLKFCLVTVRPFAKSLMSKVAPAISLLPYNCIEDMRTLAAQQHNATVQVRAHIQRAAPIMFLLYAAVMQHFLNDDAVWQALNDFVEDICALVQTTIESERNSVYTELEQEEIELLASSGKYVGKATNAQLEELWGTGCYFPGRPVIRTVKHVRLRHAEKPSRMCTKLSKEAGSCGPGVVLVYCVVHSNCIGFMIQEHSESPRMIFEMLVSRFRTQPKSIIYDNGCNLSEYVLNRAPRLFKDTKFFVDGFHFASHTNCSPSFDTHHNLMVCESLNTSVVEQKNSRISKIGRLSPLQLYRTFAAFFRFSIGKSNLDQERTKLRRGQQ
jgi:hypothetical protein